MNIEDTINNNINTDWKPILIKLLQPYKNNINNKLINEINIHGVNKIFPQEKLIFSCFNYFNISDLKCLIIGQDCYHTTGKMFFHYQQKNVLKKLINIFKELDRTKNIEQIQIYRTEYFIIKYVFNCFRIFPNSHSYIWKDYINDIVKWIAKM